MMDPDGVQARRLVRVAHRRKGNRVKFEGMRVM